MYVDPRVAHGIARTALQDSILPLKDTVDKVRRALMVLCRSLTQEKSMRALRRSLPKHLPLFSKQVGGNVSMVEYGGSILLAFTRASITEDGVCAHQFVVDCGTWTVSQAPIARTTQHALARLMQRCRTMDFNDIRMPTVEGMVRALMLREKALEQNWQQIGVPTAGGLFVGNINHDDGAIVLSTWFVPGAGGQLSRWAPYMLDLGEHAKSSPPSEHLTEKELHQYWDSVQSWAESLPLAELTRRHPFLLKPYQAQQDSSC